MKKITREQAAYIAGFLEGEGSFVISYKRSNPLNGRPSLIPCISTGQKDPIPLNYLLKTTGVGHISYRVSKNGFSSYKHSITKRADMVGLIPVIYPYLRSPRTRKRAWCVYNLAKLRNEDGTNASVTDENYKSRMKIYEIWKPTRRPRSKVKRIK